MSATVLYYTDQSKENYCYLFVSQKPRINEWMATVLWIKQSEDLALPVLKTFTSWSKEDAIAEGESWITNNLFQFNPGDRTGL